MDIFSIFCGVFMVQCLKLMLRIFEFGVLLCECFCLSVYLQNVTCLKCFTRYGHYAGEMEDIIIGGLAVVSEIAVPKIRAFSCGLMTLC